MRKGFTLFELMVVVAIIATTLAFTTASASRLRFSSSSASFADARRIMQTACYACFIENGTLPGTTAAPASPTNYTALALLSPNMQPFFPSNFEFSNISYLNQGGQWKIAYTANNNINSNFSVNVTNLGLSSQQVSTFQSLLTPTSAPITSQSISTTDISTTFSMGI